ADQLDHALALFRVGPDVQFEGVATYDFFRAVAGEPAEALVDLDVAAAVQLADGDGVRAGVERLGELLLAGLERRLGGLALGDVAEGGGDAQLAVDADEAAGDDAAQLAAFPGAEACDL